MQTLRVKGIAEQPWARQLSDACIQLLSSRATKTSTTQYNTDGERKEGGHGAAAGQCGRVGSCRKVYFASAMSSAYVCRSYPPRAPGYGQVRLPWKPHFDGAWKAEGDGHKWLYDEKRRINMRRFDVKLLQVGPAPSILNPKPDTRHSTL